MDIGDFSRRTILTGAGWTRNWGGRLALEIQQDLLGHPSVQANRRLRELILREPSFELALGKMDNEACNAADRRALEQALLDAFLSIDREISRPDRDPWINHYKVQEMLFGFGGRLGQKVVYCVKQHPEWAYKSEDI